MHEFSLQKEKKIHTPESLTLSKSKPDWRTVLMGPGTHTVGNAVEDLRLLPSLTGPSISGDWDPHHPSLYWMREHAAPHRVWTPEVDCLCLSDWVSVPDHLAV